MYQRFTNVPIRVHTNSVSHYNILLLLLQIKNYNSSQIRIRPENNTRRFSDEIHTQNSFDKSVTTLWHGVVLLKPNRFEIKAQPKFWDYLTSNAITGTPNCCQLWRLNLQGSNNQFLTVMT